ncbi:MAG: pitrilysin family protein [Alicyclobacillaceae bacterium]|nr:pitrilysin family protein [Alicyclobacillaceae bacterium]
MAFETVAVPGGLLHLWRTEQFRTITVVACWIWPLTRESVTAVSLLPHLLLRGTRRLPEFDDIQKAFGDLYGSSIHGDVKRKGELQTIEFAVQVPGGRFIEPGLDLLGPALELLREVMWEPFLESPGAFEARRVSMEKEQHRKRIASLFDDKVAYAAQRCAEEMFSGQVYGAPRYGFAEDLARLDGGALYELYERIRNGSPLHLFAVGPFDPELLVAWAERNLPAAGAVKRPSVGPLYTAGRPVRKVVEPMDVMQGKLNVGYRTGIGWGDDPFPALLMYNGILGGFPHSKLFVHVREKANLAYYASSRLDVHKGVLYVQTGIPSDRMEAAMEIVDRQVEAMARGDISEEEWTWTKIGLQNQYRELRDSPYAVVDLAFTGWLYGRNRMPEDLVRDLESVTPEAVAAVAAGVQKDTVYFLQGKEGPGGGGAGV